MFYFDVTPLKKSLFFIISLVKIYSWHCGGSIQPSYVVFCVVQSSADLCVGLFHSGGSFHIRGYEPILSLLLFVSALALHSRQLDLKLRLDFLWAVQVRKCVYQCVRACERGFGCWEA